MAIDGAAADNNAAKETERENWRRKAVPDFILYSHIGEDDEVNSCTLLQNEQPFILFSDSVEKVGTVPFLHQLSPFGSPFSSVFA
jgi:hypothetical protein